MWTTRDEEFPPNFKLDIGNKSKLNGRKIAWKKLRMQEKGDSIQNMEMGDISNHDGQSA